MLESQWPQGRHCTSLFTLFSISLFIVAACCENIESNWMLSVLSWGERMFILQVVRYGSGSRSTGSSGANSQSSRSHAILQMEVRDSRDFKVGRWEEALRGARCIFLAMHLSFIMLCLVVWLSKLLDFVTLGDVAGSVCFRACLHAISLLMTLSHACILLYMQIICVHALNCDCGICRLLQKLCSGLSEKSTVYASFNKVKVQNI